MKVQIGLMMNIWKIIEGLLNDLMALVISVIFTYIDFSMHDTRRAISYVLIEGFVDF